jgi:hypothetical protein
MGHYAVTCPERKKKTHNMAASVEVDDFSSRFVQDFAFMAEQLGSSVSSMLWYIDSGASSHMSGVREQFIELRQQTHELDIVLRDKRAVSVVGIGTVAFQRESLHPLKLLQVLYVPGLKKNLVSVSCIEEKGYVVTFRDEHVLLYPKGGNILEEKVIGVQYGRMYRMIWETSGAFVCMTSNKDLCELWHKRMGHLHHGALRIAREITIGILEFSIEHDDVCRGCALGKYTKAPFPERDTFGC